MLNTFTVKKDTLSEKCGEITKYLEKTKADKKEIQSTILLIEELSLMFFAQAGPGEIKLRVRSRLGTVNVCMASEGEEYNPLLLIREWDEDNEEEMIRHRILCAYQARLSYTRKNRRNLLYIQVHEDTRKNLNLTLGAMVIGLAASVLMKFFLPEDITEFVDTNFLKTIETLFMNALKLMIAPVVFFSIASSVGGLSGAAQLGKMAMKVFGFYMLTTVIAIGVGFALTQIVFIGDMNVDVSGFGEAYTSTETFELTFRGLITGIIPTNLVDPISSGDMLQIMFIAIIVGIAANALGDKVKLIHELIYSGNELFLHIVKMIMGFLPLVSFVSMASMLINLGVESIAAILRLTAGLLLGIAIMVLVYTLIFKIITRLPAGIFIKKLLSYMPIPFALSSSSAAIPASIEFCEKKLGIDSRLVSFSIPFGSVVNMDGVCIYLVLASWMFLKIYGIEITPTLIFTIAIMALVLSVGAPGVVGSGFICLSTILSSLGIPIGCIGMVVGIDAFYSMCRTASNAGGDVAISAVVAYSENMLDKEVFMKR